MAWPTPQEFNEAIQNPRQAFSDPELQLGTPELTSLGLPRPITGGFASVYRMQCGARSWAVRCFLRERADQEQRYAAISEHLSAARLPYTVAFRFLPQGIKVRGQWFPILKMEWVQGEPLNQFVAAHLHDPTALLSLAERWVRMTQALRRASIGHGDLQHGNVFVDRGDPRLVDYDGMYVPALADRDAQELGHRNYQHPARADADFGPALDNFSSWVVFVSLLALSVEPRLWERFQGGDECLILRREDFQNPEQSELLRAMDACKDARLHAVAALFRSLLYLSPSQVPSLDGRAAPPTPAPPSTATDSGAWLRDHLPNPGTAPSSGLWAREEEEAAERSEEVEEDPSWLLQLVRPGPPSIQRARFQHSPWLERGVLVLSVVFLALLVRDLLPVRPSLPVLLWLALALAAANALFWLVRYRHEPAAAELLSLRSRLRAREREIRQTAVSLAAAEREKQAVRRRDQEARIHQERERAAVEARERRDQEAVQATSRSASASIEKRRHDLLSKQAAALQTIQRKLGPRIDTLDRRIQQITQAETSEVNAALQALQTRYLEAYLRRFSVEQAAIDGIHRETKAQLVAAGFRTAGDIDYLDLQEQVGIGPAHASALRDWKDQVIVEARKSMPRALPAAEERALRARHEAKRTPLAAERAREHAHRTAEESATTTYYKVRIDILDRELAGVERKQREELAKVKTKHRPRYGQIEQSLWALTRALDSELSKIDLEIVQTRRSIFDLTWQQGQLERDLASADPLTWNGYVRRIILPGS